MRCEFSENPTGIDVSNPRLFWMVESDQRATTQSAYQILVATTTNQLTEDAADLWNSDKVNSDQTVYVRYAGKPLASSQQAFWKIRVWDQNGNVSPWSEPASWTMGLLPLPGETASQDAPPLGWKARWICAPATSESLLLRKEFSVKPGLKRAILHVTGLGQYELNLNGAKIGDDLLSPGWTDYNDTILYDTRDITSALKQGRNAIGLTLGNGMYHVVRRNRFAKFTGSFGPLRAIAQLELEYANGSREIVVTDQTWKTNPGAITYSSIYGGEDFDARLNPTGWDQAGFNDASWPNAVLVVRPSGKLVGHSAASDPIRAIEVRKPVAVKQLSERIAVYDLGQNASYMPRIRVAGPAGSTIRLTPAEVVNADGSIQRSTMGSTNRGLSWWQYTKATDDEETWFPKFYYVGCRYLEATLTPAEQITGGTLTPALSHPMGEGERDRAFTQDVSARTNDGSMNLGQTEHSLSKIGSNSLTSENKALSKRMLENLPNAKTNSPSPIGWERAGVRVSKLPQIESLEGVVVHSIATPVGEFECSNPLLNRIRDLVRWAQRANMVSVLTDCPHREKLGWLEQYHLNGPSIRYEFDLARMFTKGMNDMADAQTADGLIPNIAPEYTEFKGTFRAAAEWGSAFIIVPWQQYQFCGDVDLLRAHYGEMKRYFAYLESRATNNILSEGLGDWFDLGPKKSGRPQHTPPPVTATAFFYHDAWILSRVAELLGKEDDAKLFSNRAAEIRASYNREFFHADRGSYATDSQCANALPLVFGIVEPEQRVAVLKSLLEDLKSRDYLMTAGDVGFRFLLQALAQGGESDAIYRMINQDEKPGYGFMLKHGETSLTEAWDANLTTSHNHFMLGQIIEWFYKDVAGIDSDPEGPGFQKIIIRPQPAGDLTWARASYDSIHGKIVSDWKRENGQFILKIRIPANTTATVFLPAKSLDSITESGRPAGQSEGVKFLRQENGRAIFAIGSGEYNFHAPF
ncbi:MAG TPA: family 78 glycoside hydrolase catalytic domain [Verrucomicrobiae bacterium]|nr:family 78 glycoside hydrolase catalytic domain [Verrucomicrobiae bacterium]